MTRPRVFFVRRGTELRTHDRRWPARPTPVTTRFLQDDLPMGPWRTARMAAVNRSTAVGADPLVGDAYGAEPSEADLSSVVFHTQSGVSSRPSKGRRPGSSSSATAAHATVRATNQISPESNSRSLEPAAAQTGAERKALSALYRDRLVQEITQPPANDDTALENIIPSYVTNWLEQAARRDPAAQAVAVYCRRRLDWAADAEWGGWWRPNTGDHRAKGRRRDTEKIRAHLLTTIEETHRQELSRSRDRQRLARTAAAARGGRRCPRHAADAGR